MGDQKSPADYAATATDLWNQLKSLGRASVSSKLGVATLGSSLFVADAVYAWYIESNRIPRIVRAFEKGSKHLTPLEKREHKYYPRPNIERELRSVISPPFFQSFNFITGEHGTGKTTAVRSVCQQIGAGVVYTFLPPAATEQDVVETIGEAVNYDFDPPGGFWHRIRTRVFNYIPVRKEVGLKQVLGDVAIAADRYQRKWNRPASLVIDNITDLVDNDSPTFEHLAKYAKYEGNQGRLAVTFVTSESDTPHPLATSSETFRFGDVFEVPDLTDDEALEYLKGISKKEIIYKEAVDFVGGRMNLLLEADKLMGMGKSVQYVRKKLIGEAVEQIKGEEFFIRGRATQRQAEAWNAIIRILDSPYCEEPADNFSKSISEPKWEAQFLYGHIFSYHPTRRTVGISSRPMATALKDFIGHPDSEKRSEFLLSLATTTL